MLRLRECKVKLTSMLKKKHILKLIYALWAIGLVGKYLCKTVYTLTAYASVL